MRRVISEEMRYANEQNEYVYVMGKINLLQWNKIYGSPTEINEASVHICHYRHNYDDIINTLQIIGDYY